MLFYNRKVQLVTKIYYKNAGVNKVRRNED